MQTSDGSTARLPGLLHRSSAQLRELTWTADGHHVAYIRSGVGADDSLMQHSAFGDSGSVLTTATRIGSLHALPGTGRLVYWESQTGSATSGIFVHDVQSGSRSTVPNSSGLAILSADVSPDGRYLVYEERAGTSTNLFTIELASGARQQITSDGSSGWPTWSEW